MDSIKVRFAFNGEGVLSACRFIDGMWEILEHVFVSLMVFRLENRGYMLRSSEWWGDRKAVYFMFHRDGVIDECDATSKEKD